MSLKDSLLITKPEGGQILPLVVDCPHAGLEFPDDAATIPDRAGLAASAQDAHTDVLAARVPMFGGTTLTARFSRAFIDPNRAPDDMDPLVLTPDARVALKVKPTDRGTAGYGVLWSRTRDGAPIYQAPLDASVVQARLMRFYHPYHMILGELLGSLRQKFGIVLHINLHTYPDLAAPDVDVVLGTREGDACDPAIAARAKAYLQHVGQRVALNAPYKGAEILRRHGAPRAGCHSLQLEIRHGAISGNVAHWQQIVAELAVTLASHLPARGIMR